MNTDVTPEMGPVRKSLCRTANMFLEAHRTGRAFGSILYPFGFIFYPIAMSFTALLLTPFRLVEPEVFDHSDHV